MKKIKDILSYIILSILIIYVYTFFHEIGHAIVGVIYNAKISKFVLGIAACVKFSNANFTDMQMAIMKISGIILPNIILYFLLIIYSYKVKNKMYQYAYVFFSICTTATILSPIILPILHTVRNLSPGEDIADFIYFTNINPYLISGVAFLILVFNIFLINRKGIFDKLIELKEGENLNGSI